MRYALVLFLTIAGNVLAQSRDDSSLPSPPLPFDQAVKFEHLTLEDGLPQGTIYDIHEDELGFLWFATQEGVSRYDGYSFKNYTHVPFDSTSLSPNWVWAIDEDSSGALWLAVSRSGLSRLDPATGVITRFRHDSKDSTTVGRGPVLDVHVDRSGLIWVGTGGGGLNRMDPSKPGRFDRYVHDPDDGESLSHNVVRFIREDSAGMLWISTLNGLNRMDPRRPGRFRSYLANDSNSQTGSDQISVINEIVQDLGDPVTFWVGTAGGLLKLNAETASYRRFLPNPGQEGGNFVRAIASDPIDTGVLWIASGAGLHRFDTRAETFTSFRHEPGNPNSLISDATSTIHVDRTGTIWVGMNTAGISRFNPSAVRFRHYEYRPGRSDGLANPHVWGLLVDRRGSLWVGTDRGFLHRIDRKTGKVDLWESSAANPLDPRQPAGIIRTFAEGRDGHIWMATSRGVDRYDPTSGQFRHYRHDPDNSRSLLVDASWSVVVDSKGSVWVGTFGGGLHRYNPSTDDFDRIAPDVFSGPAGGGPPIWDIHEDSRGMIWVATDGFLARIDLDEPENSVRFRHNPRNPEGITNGGVMWIHERESEPGILWLGTGGGLDRLDTRTGKFSHYTAQNSDLPNNTVYAILEDDEGRLWMSTNRGISRFDPGTEEFKNFGMESGLQALEFDAGSATRAFDGEMFFGGVNGLNAFFPHDVDVNKAPPHVVLTDLKIFNKSVRVGPDSPLKSDLARTGEIKLSFDQARNIGFEFVALHFMNPEKNRYAYRLEGFDADWIDAGTQRSAAYTNLPPGTYTFRVKAANSDGVWNEEGAALLVSVLPPWWRTTWAYVFYAILAIGGFVATDRVQRRRVLKKALLEQAELRARAAESEKEAADARAKAAESDVEAATARAKALEVENERKRDAELLSEIGKEITSTLELETIFGRLYEHVNRLVEAPIFGVGLYDPEREQIDYRLAMENGVRFAPYSRNTTDKNQLPVWCLEKRSPVFVNDIDVEYSRYIASYESSHGSLEDGSISGDPLSLIYLPLITKDRVLGVISVQSFRKHAYTEHDLNVLQALATYTAIAVDNADAYRRLNATLDNLRDAQQQLVQQEKLASLGQLTAGIAHEIKNPLNFITNFSSLNEELTSELGEVLRANSSHLPEEVKREVEDLLASLRVNSGHVSKHGRRADSIVKSMMEHASGGQGERYPVELNAFLDEYVNLAYHGKRAQNPGFEVVLERSFDEYTGTVEMAPQEIGRVILNLLTNAFDAVSEKKSTSSSGFTPRVVVGTSRRNGQVLIRVEDNGSGIPAHIRGRIFEPFFTTKPAGSGTGLGLSLSHDIVAHGHGGSLTVESREGEGTTFIVALPAK